MDFHKDTESLAVGRVMSSPSSASSDEVEKTSVPQLRAKTSLRMKYESEATVIEKRLGGLDEIRSRLGLNRRKMCQLLLVDPTAWNRWLKPGENAPPHIWRALDWYLALSEKYPETDHRFWLQGIAQVGPMNAEMAKKVENLESKIEELTKVISSLQNQSRQVEVPRRSWWRRLFTR